MDAQDIVISNKIKEFYESRGVKRLAELFTFEFLDDVVKVEVLREGREYHGSSVMYLSYVEFNEIVKAEDERRDGWDLLLRNGVDHVTFTDDTIGWEYKNGGFYVRERVGGNLGAITYNGREVDRGSVYIVTTYWGDDNDNLKYMGTRRKVEGNIELIKIEKNEAIIYRKDHNNLVEIEELKRIVENKMKKEDVTLKEYKDRGISQFFRLNTDDVSERVQREILRAINENGKIDWGSI